MVRYCKILPHYYRNDERFEGMNVDKIRVYAIDKQSAVIEADWKGAAHPGRHDSASEHYTYYDPAIKDIWVGFCWISLDNIKLLEFNNNEDALLTLRRDGDGDAF